MNKILALGAVAALFGMTASNASAAVQGSGLLGWGFDDGLKFGLGARGGIDLPNDFWGGATFLYHFGNEIVSGSGYTTKTWFLQAEGGYTIHSSSDSRVRPFVGIGIADRSSPDITVGGVTTSGGATNLAITPGVAFEKDFGSGNMFFGGEARLNLVDGNSSVGFYASLGLRY